MKLSCKCLETCGMTCSLVAIVLMVLMETTACLGELKRPRPAESNWILRMSFNSANAKHNHIDVIREKHGI